ncbi:unnamed protein product [Caretta caretta]
MTLKKVPSEEIGKMGSDVPHKPHDSRMINMEVTDTEEEVCVGEEVASNDSSGVDNLLMEDGEDKLWFRKVKLVQTHKVTLRLEAKSGIMQHDILLLPFNASNQWVIVFAIPHLPSNWKIHNGTLENIVEHKRQTDGHNYVWTTHPKENMEYCNFVTCKKENEGCMMKSSVTLVRGEHIPPAFQREPMRRTRLRGKKYSCKTCA